VLANDAINQRSNAAVSAKLLRSIRQHEVPCVQDRPDRNRPATIRCRFHRPFPLCVGPAPSGPHSLIHEKRCIRRSLIPTQRSGDRRFDCSRVRVPPSGAGDKPALPRVPRPGEGSGKILREVVQHVGATCAARHPGGPFDHRKKPGLAAQINQRRHPPDCPPCPVFATASTLCESVFIFEVELA